MVQFSRHFRLVLIVTATLLVAGCGTRVGHDQVVAAAGGGPVHLSAQSLAALQAVPAGSAAAGRPSSPAGVIPSSPAPGVALPPPSHAASPIASVATPAQVRLPPSASTPAAAAAVPLPPNPAQAAAAPSCTGTEQPVAIGQIGTFSGVAGPITAGAKAMSAAWAAELNSHGGLDCHPVQVFAADDGGDPQRAAALVQQLVADHHVVAFVGSVVPFSVSGFRSGIEAAHVPAIGGESGTSDFFDSPWFFPAGASAADQALGTVRNGADAFHRKVAVIYCVESSGCTQIFHAIKDHAADRAGAQVVYSAPVSLVQTDFTAQCLNARNAGADQIALAMDGASMIRLAHSCAAIGYRPLLSAVASQIAPAQAADPTLRSFGLATATAASPWLLDDSRALAAYHAALTRYAPSSQPDAESAGAWAACRLLQAALEHEPATASSPITAEMVLRGLAQIHQDTLDGMTGPISFSPGEAHATSNGCVFYETLGPDGWSAPRGNQRVCLGRA